MPGASASGVLFGMALVVAGHLLQLGAYLALAGPAQPLPDNFAILIGFGLIQLLYVVPLGLALRRRRRVVWGILCAALLTLGANGLLWVLILGGGGALVP